MRAWWALVKKKKSKSCHKRPKVLACALPHLHTAEEPMTKKCILEIALKVVDVEYFFFGNCNLGFLFVLATLRHDCDSAADCLWKPKFFLALCCNS